MNAPAATYDNPLGLDGFEFVEFTGPDPEALAGLFTAMGFTHLANHRSKNVRRYTQGDINFLLNMEPIGQVADFREAHGPSANALMTDAPVDNHGKGESFSPTDLVATALGTCMLTTMGIVAQRHNLDMTGATARVTKEMVTTPLRRIGRLALDVHLPRPQEYAPGRADAHHVHVGRGGETRMTKFG